MNAKNTTFAYPCYTRHIMNLKSRYDRIDFTSHLKTRLLPGDFRSDPRELARTSGAKGALITSAVRLGQSPSLKLTILELTHASENDPRVTLSRETFRLMRQYNLRNVLAAFRSETSDFWRLSLVTSDLEYDEASDRVIREFSNPRRFSFMLGPGAKTGTAEKKLDAEGPVYAFDELAARFSLEVVNKEFYQKVAKLFSELCGGTRLEGNKEVEYPGVMKLPTSSHETRQEFAVRLIGRIVFCWFLKQKNLVGEEWLTSKGAKETRNYYHCHVEPLFFEILNTPQRNRKDLYKAPSAANIPFLNGGLFAPHANDFYEYDAGTKISNMIGVVKIPDEWLSSFFEVLETYNFTIDENTTVDVDLSIDPEMLGRIFENLLAEINPETGETARKKTGSFYTPRAIVDYMVTESLASYLARKMPTLGEDGGERLRSLFAYEKGAEDSARFTDAERDAIVRAFHDMRCLDPACGSGAFPMGVLQKTLIALEKLDPDGEAFISRQLENIPDEVTRSQVEEMLRAKGYQYVHKLSLIQGCIYGVDIQPIAVEMSRLRAFLSLIVDEREDDSKENRGVRHLPNLDFKFVCANSLVHIPATKKQMELGEDNSAIKRLQSLRATYLNASGDRKLKYKAEFQDAFDIIKDSMRWAGTTGDGMYAKAISDWDPFADDECPWFDSSWMFGIGGESGPGFDVVIGNPPYIQLQKIKETSDALGKEGYATHAKTGDIYAIFYERGAQLLRDGGTLCYITSNKWMRAAYGEKLRSFFLGTGHFSQLIDFGDSPIFENATTYTNIALWRKGKADETPTLAWDLSRSFTNESNLPSMLAATPLGLPLFSSDSFVIANHAEASLKARIEQVGTPLKDWDISINYGIKTGLNEAFIIDQKKYDELVATDPKSADILKPILRGRDIKRYKADWAGLYLIYIPWHFPLQNDSSIKGASIQAEQAFIKEFSVLYNHLESFRPALSARNTAETGIRYEWYAMQRWGADYWKDFSKKKITWGNLAQRPQFTLAQEDFVVNAPSPFISECQEIRYILAVLNSKICEYYLKQICVERAGGFFEYKPMFIEQLPIPQIPESEQVPFNLLVDIIQETRKSGLDTEGDFLEKVVDLMVYALYFREEAMRDGLYITGDVTTILAGKEIAPHAIPSIVGKMKTNANIDAAIRKGVPI